MTNYRDLQLQTQSNPEPPHERSSRDCLPETSDAISGMRVAIVHDWLATYAGSERVLSEILRLYPNADLFAVVDFLPPGQREFLAGRKVNVSFIQCLPMARKIFRWYLPLMPLAMEQIDLSIYDLIISSSHAVSKGVLTSGHQIHISYVHTPIRYAWDLQEQYLDRRGGTGRMRSAMARVLMHYLRIWDIRTSTGVDHFVANSQFVARRIMKTYRRSATVVYPPVDVDKFPFTEKKEDFYITVARLVSYKRIDLLVEAFGSMPDRKLVIIGDGPELSALRCQASANIQLMGALSSAQVKDHLTRAKAFVYAGEEDFGISMVEAQACGTPVLAFARGGAAEIVLDGQTGLLFDRQTPDAIVNSVCEFEDKWQFEPSRSRRNAMRFSVNQFREGLRTVINNAVREHKIVGSIRLGPVRESKTQRSNLKHVDDVPPILRSSV